MGRDLYCGGGYRSVGNLGGRDKGGPFVEAMLRHKIVDGMVAVERIALLPIIDEHQQRLRDWTGFARGVS